MPEYSTAGMSLDERENLFKAASIVHQHGPLLCEALGRFMERMQENEGLMSSLAAEGGNGMVTAAAAADSAANFAHRAAEAGEVIRSINDVHGH
ncbi:hypothetical protein ACIQUL_36175 [Streptomyces sp. NPDC090303]|uniref:hypothetical protein n=1 Tax=Streptomyces sp. NPDC090303 TaxID=3365960 RepID=UPI00382964AE